MYLVVFTFWLVFRTSSAREIHKANPWVFLIVYHSMCMRNVSTVNTYFVRVGPILTPNTYFGVAIPKAQKQDTYWPRYLRMIAYRCLRQVNLEGNT